MAGPQQSPPAQAQTAVATKKPIDQVRDLLDKAKPQIALAVPRHLTPDRLLRVALTAVGRTPKLLDCDRRSLLQAVMDCAQLGLEPDGVLGHAFLVPFKGKVVMIPGYKGYIALARRSGQVDDVAAHVVQERDTFDYEYGDRQFLKHKPAKGDRGQPTHAYAYFRLKDGGFHFEVLEWAEVLAIRDKSPAWQMPEGKRGPWETHEKEMARKTAVRALAKYMPLSVEFQKAAAYDELVDVGKYEPLASLGELDADATAEATRQRAEQLREQYAGGEGGAEGSGDAGAKTKGQGAAATKEEKPPAATTGGDPEPGLPLGNREPGQDG